MVLHPALEKSGSVLGDGFTGLSPGWMLSPTHPPSHRSYTVYVRSSVVRSSTRLSAWSSAPCTRLGLGSISFVPAFLRVGRCVPTTNLNSPVGSMFDPSPPCRKFSISFQLGTVD